MRWQRFGLATLMAAGIAGAVNMSAAASAQQPPVQPPPTTQPPTTPAPTIVPATRGTAVQVIPTLPPPPTTVKPAPPPPSPYAVPANSGAGRRVVYSKSRMRVWIVEADGRVARTYLVSGSVTDNLKPGVYQVYSKSPTATGIDDSGTMRYMVRFTYGENAAKPGHWTPGTSR